MRVGCVVAVLVPSTEPINRRSARRAPLQLTRRSFPFHLPHETARGQRSRDLHSVSTHFVMSSESLALSGVEWVETSLTISKCSKNKPTVRDSSTTVGMTIRWTAALAAPSASPIYRRAALFDFGCALRAGSRRKTVSPSFIRSRRSRAIVSR